MTGHSRFRSLAFLPFLLAAFLVPPEAAAMPVGAPEIGPGDTLRIRVLEWRPSTGEPFAWEALEGDYVVGPDGMIALPLIGTIEAQGQDRTAIGAAIGERLKESASLLQAPSAVVEVAEWRPVFVAGAVDRPGAYPFRPPLTVLQAVSLAGGMRRSADPFARIERDSITGRGQLRVVALELDQLGARRARLEAELAGADAIDFPEELVERRADPAIGRLLREEELIFVSRGEALEQEVAANQRLETLLREQVEQLEEQVALKERQLESLREETESVRDLVQRGLTTATRLSDLERRLTGYESDRGDIIRSIIRAQVDINQAERNVIALRASHRREISRELRDTQGAIEELHERFATASALVQEAEVIAPARSLARERQSEQEPIFTVIRMVDGAPTEMDADEKTLVLPGDTVRAVLPLPDIGAFGIGPSASRPAPAATPASLAATDRRDSAARP